MKILITGASCAGSTTLGIELSERLNYPYFDTDTYFWERTAIPFTLRRDPELRNHMLRHVLAQEASYIVGGSLMGWGEEWPALFDLVIFLYLPHDVRMGRLKKREFERYGEQLMTVPARFEQYKAFLNWASGYDDNTTVGRNLSAHRCWLGQLPCTVLEISGDKPVADRLDLIVSAMATG